MFTASSSPYFMPAGIRQTSVLCGREEGAIRWDVQACAKPFASSSESTSRIGLTLINRGRAGKTMDASVPRPRRNYSFIASIMGGVLVCIDYVDLLVVIATLPPGDTSGLRAFLPLVLIALACGLAMIASSYLGRSSSERKWTYILLGSSLLSLFLAVRLISFVGAILGSAAAVYLLTKRRMQPPVKSA